MTVNKIVAKHYDQTLFSSFYICEWELLLQEFGLKGGVSIGGFFVGYYGGTSSPSLLKNNYYENKTEVSII